MGCLKFFVVLSLLVFGVLVIGSTAQLNRTTPETSERATPAPTPSAPYIDQLRQALAAIAAYDNDPPPETVEGIVLASALFQSWAEVAADAASGALSSDEQAARNTLIAELSALQRKWLPVLRDAYGPAARRRLWEVDGKARTVGTGFRTVQFTAAEFAANRNIKAMHEATYPLLLQLRFTRAEYRWFDQAPEYTYYEIDPPNDSEVGVWRSLRFTRVE